MIDWRACIGEPPQHRDYRWKEMTYEPVMIDATATVEAFASIDCGIERPTRIGARSWIMKHAHIGHDVEVGEGVIVCPMSSIGGHATLCDGVRVDMGVTVKPYVTVGKGARLGMGAVVLHDVPEGEVWVGNPARRLR